MLQSVNIAANAIIFLGTMWLVLSKRVPTQSAAALLLGLINFSALGNMVSIHACHSEPEILSNVALAVAMCWAFWRIEIRKALPFSGPGW